MIEGIERARAKGVVVVIATRTAGGRPFETYAYPGSVGDAKAHGAIRGAEATAAQNRLKLMVILSAYPELAAKPDEIEALMDV